MPVSVAACRTIDTDIRADISAFSDDCIAGLSRTPKSLPCKWLYDDAGSQLFEHITALAEYYPSRTEEALLREASLPVARALDGFRSLVEFGSGASRKTRLILAAATTIETYVPIDISATELDRAQTSLRVDFPRLAIDPICADFTAPDSLDLCSLRGPVLAFFPGSTLANMAPPQAIAFLGALRRNIGPETRLLLGVDVVKDERVLCAAYDDAKGVTAAFNLNLLTRMTRELGAGVDVTAFRHRAIWNAEEHCIEMHLEASSRQEIAIGDERFVIEAGETIHTESSYKFSVDHWQGMFAAAGWRLEDKWLSPAPQFLLALLAVDADEIA